jgi:hypothetical protein
MKTEDEGLGFFGFEDSRIPYDPSFHHLMIS